MGLLSLLPKEDQYFDLFTQMTRSLSLSPLRASSYAQLSPASGKQPGKLKNL